MIRYRIRKRYTQGGSSIYRIESNTRFDFLKELLDPHVLAVAFILLPIVLPLLIIICAGLLFKGKWERYNLTKTDWDLICLEYKRKKEDFRWEELDLILIVKFLNNASQIKERKQVEKVSLIKQRKASDKTIKTEFLYP